MCTFSLGLTVYHDKVIVAVMALAARCAAQLAGCGHGPSMIRAGTAVRNMSCCGLQAAAGLKRCASDAAVKYNDFPFKCSVHVLDSMCAKILGSTFSSRGVTLMWRDTKSLSPGRLLSS